MFFWLWLCIYLRCLVGPLWSPEDRRHPSPRAGGSRWDTRSKAVDRRAWTSPQGRLPAFRASCFGRRWCCRRFCRRCCDRYGSEMWGKGKGREGKGKGKENGKGKERGWRGRGIIFLSTFTRVLRKTIQYRMPYYGEYQSHQSLL